MRKAVFLFFLLLGIGIGFLSVRDEEWGLCIVMMCVGALFGGAIGGGLSGIGSKQKGRLPLRSEEEENPIPGMGYSGRDLAANYWRDKGHPPFMKPPEPDPTHGSRMFDPDKLQ
ncbi:hypothetical protein [Thauera sp. Sel9]|uniref:hypothetical protein n=1 Tax=Thauera sp. Sel9 TaxID=2974299 RepID=UPI0021E1AE19|nr:hypothetical protein [Thauera sp. Sel9]MCV2219838.1 hypothetical protein [Thauera sp. Sel9]